MRILIVDDEPPARERLAALCREIAPEAALAQAADGREALAAVAATAPHVVLLDVRMPVMDGLEAARHLARLDEPPAVIFTTAFDSHALAAFEARAVDYLLKPIRKARLADAIARARRLTRAQVQELGAASGAGTAPRTHVSATMSGRLELVPVAEVRYFRAEDKYVCARHPGGRLLLDDSLVSLEQEFGEGFLRVHRNALVARIHVRALTPDARGAPRVRLHGI